MFTRPSAPIQTQETSSRTLVNRQKLKSISSFFPSFSQQDQPDESHVIPYQQPSPQARPALYDGLPSIKNGSNISLPLHGYQPSPSQSISSLRLKVEIQNQTQTQREDNGGITYTSHNLQAQISREIPTLASAIHIPDSSITKTQPQTIETQQQGIHPLYHMNASSTSLLGSYVQVNEIIQVVNDQDIGRRESSDSRTSNINDGNGTLTKRRMSRRLSLDNIVPKITGSLRKRERSSSKSSVLDITGGDNGTGRRWSLFSSAENKTNQQTEPKVIVEPPKPAINKTANQMAMPVSRNWRKKFTVTKNPSTTNTTGSGAADREITVSRLEAARQARDRSRAYSAEARERYDERTIKRIPVKGMKELSVDEGEKTLKERQSMISMMGRGNDVVRGIRDVEGSAANLSFIRRPSSIASSFDPATTPKSTSSIPIPFVPTGPPTVTGLPESQTATSLAATFDSPSPLPRPLHTPSNRLRALGVPSTAARGQEMFSPAQDDRSILDPARSPYPIPDTSPLVPMSGLQYQNMPLPPPPVQQEKIVSAIQQVSTTCKDETMPEEGKNDTLDMSSLDQSLNEIAAELPSKSSLSSSTSTTMAGIIAQPSQTGTFGVSDSAQTWHTASASPPVPSIPTSSSTRTIYTLPRSKSKSHTDLSSYASTKNLVDHIEATQGPGWWSSDKRTNQRNSSITLRIKSEESEKEQNQEEEELKRLERLAQSTTLPHRAKFSEENDQMEIISSPTLNRMKEDDKLRTRSSLDLRSSYRSNQQPRPSNILNESIRSNGQQGGYNARPSLMAGSIWSKDIPPSPRRSVLAKQSTMSLNYEKGTPNRLRPAQIPLPPSEPRGNVHGTFISNRISPDIARRASFLSKSDNIDNAENGSPTRSTSRQTTRTTLSSLSMNSSSHSNSNSNSSAPTSIQSDSDQDEISKSPTKFEKLQLEWETKIQSLKSRHTLEIDAVLSALSNSKIENQSLKEDNNNLVELINDTIKENQNLKEKIRILCMSLQTMELGSTRNEIDARNTMRRSESVVSTLLPELIQTNQISNINSPISLRYNNNSQEDDKSITMINEIDELGRKPLPSLPLPLTSDSISKAELRNKGIMNSLSKSRKSSIPPNSVGGGRRNVSGNSMNTEESNILFDGPDLTESESQEEGWTLRLKESDERYLDDL